jgi:ribosome-binding factor A
MSTKAYQRCQRVADLVHRELSQIFYRNIADPRLQGLTITYVKISKDLRHASIGITQLAPRFSESAIVAASRKAATRLRYLLAAVLNLRATPILHFQYDNFIKQSIDLHQKIDQIAPYDDA